MIGLAKISSRVTTQASLESTPKDIRITNLTDTSTSISWISDTETTGSVSYTIDGEQRIETDVRTQQESSVQSLTHYVMLRNLHPDTSYEFAIISGTKRYEKDGTIPLTFKTFPQITTQPSAIEPSYGKVVTEDDKNAEGAIVYLSIGESTDLSSIVKQGGEWLVPLSLARTKDGTAFYIPKPGDQETIVVTLGDGRIAQAITDIDHDNPVPTITLGKTYNFLQSLKSDEKQIAQGPTGAVLGTNDKTKNTKNTSSKVNILVPSDHGTFTTTKPLFRGVGIAGKKVKITVESTPQVGDVTVSTDGTWLWSPPETLPPGQHTITIQTIDEKGKNITLKHTFTVFKSGTQVLGDATPSASLTPAVPTAPSPTQIGASPTLPVPTLTLVPTVIASPSGTQDVPRTGNFEPTILLFIVGIILVIIPIIRFIH